VGGQDRKFLLITIHYARVQIYTFSVFPSNGLNLPGAAKSNPIKLVVVSSATAWNFSVKIYGLTWLSYLHLTAERHLIIFKNDEIIDILARPRSDYCVLKTVCAETQQNSVTETTQRRVCPNDVSLFDSPLVCSKCLPQASTHLFSRSMKLLTVLLIGFCDRLSQITCNLTLLWVRWLICCCWYLLLSNTCKVPILCNQIQVY